MSADAAKQFFDTSVFATAAGTASLVWCIVNGIRIYTGFYRKWMVLGVSAVVVFGTNAILTGFDQFLVSIGNVFLVAFTATGAQETVVGAAAPGGATQQGKKEYHWFDSWF